MVIGKEYILNTGILSILKAYINVKKSLKNNSYKQFELTNTKQIAK